MTSEIPSAAVDAAAAKLWAMRSGSVTEGFEHESEQAQEGVRDVVRPILQAAAPYFVAQPECDECEDTGIYEEGDEWAPCDGCERGRDFADRLRVTVAETQAQERERVKRELLKKKPLRRSPIEAGAAAIYRFTEATQNDPPYSRLPGYAKDGYREQAEVAIEAALAAVSENHPDTEED